METVRRRELPGLGTAGRNGQGDRREVQDTEIPVCYYNDGCVPMHLSKPTDCTMARVNLKVNYGLWAIMCQRRFTLGK